MIFVERRGMKADTSHRGAILRALDSSALLDHCRIRALMMLRDDIAERMAHEGLIVIRLPSWLRWLA